LHGDTNRYNFIIDSSGEAVLIDFEKAQAGSDPHSLEKEMA
jgi:thiamine kinase-like enzyme